MGDIAKVRSVLSDAGVDLDLGKFNHRIIAQKTVFLLQLKGLDMGYDFGMYLRGPYSPSLTQDLFDDPTMQGPKEGLSDEESGMVRELVEKFGNSPVELEIAATYAYLRGVENRSAFDSWDTTWKLKSFYTKGTVAIAISRTIQYLFPPPPELIEDVKREFADMERASLEDLRRFFDEER
jgi:uncharacterized protein YwgA